MNASGTSQLGDFSVFGFTKNLHLIKDKLLNRLRVVPRIIDFGPVGYFFFHSSVGDIAETEEVVVLKFGFVRSPTGSPLTAEQLLAQKAVSPTVIDHEAFRGNGLVACFSKKEPCYTVYQTIMALPQLYYTRIDGDIFCATDLRCLLALLERPQLNEDAVPMHFLFNFVPGSSTYFRDVWRLFPGQRLKWTDGNLSVSVAQDLRCFVDGSAFDSVDPISSEALYKGMSKVMGVYLAEVRKTSKRYPGNLLSGGVDSSVLQLLINENLDQSERPLSFSFAVQASCFEVEIEYAGHASDVFQTQHMFLNILSRDYPDLLTRTIEILGQPGLYNEGEPCKLALAESLASSVPDVDCFIAGQAADALHGLSEGRQVALFEVARGIPGSRWGLHLMSNLLKRGIGRYYYVPQEAARMLAEASTSRPEAYLTLYDPTNYVAMNTGKFETARRCFGDQTLLSALDHRRSLEAEYLDSASMIEKIHIIDLLTAGYEPAVVAGQLFAACRQRLIQFYLDEDVIRMTLAFKPNARYLKGLSTKPLLKGVLARKSSSVLSRKKKAGSIFRTDLFDWMKCGPLYEMVQAIELPGFLSRSDFDELTENPNMFLWNLLTFDIFQKRVLKS